MVDLMGGRLDMLFGSRPAVKAYVDDGLVRPIAVTSSDRHDSLPDVPTMREVGYGDFEAVDWIGIFVPSSTPQDIVSRIEKSIAAAVANDRFRQRIEEVGAIPEGSSAEEFAAFLSDEPWEGMACELDLKVE